MKIFNKFKAFTIVELMSVVVILSFLLIIAIPYYKNYNTRVKISEGLAIALPYKIIISEYFLTFNSYPETAPDIGINYKPSRWVKGVYIGGNGVITVEYNENTIEGIGVNNTIELTPKLEESIIWNCKGGTLDNKFRPKECQK